MLFPADFFQQCQPPAIEQFPQPLMDKKARQKGGVIIHIAVALYMFLGLAIVCDDYFVPALDKISEGEQKLYISRLHFYAGLDLIFALKCYSFLQYSISLRTSLVQLLWPLAPLVLNSPRLSSEFLWPR